jgi:NADPH-dependent ferric siderophore reductase
MEFSPQGRGGPGGGYDPDPHAEWFLIAGDESALPAVGMLLETLPRGARARVLIKVPDAADALDPGAGPGVELSWLPRAAGQAPRSLLQRAVEETAVPAGEARVWVAAEAGVIRRIRSGLLGRRGLDPRQVVTRGYWKAGAANHPDHDYGEDVT